MSQWARPDPTVNKRQGEGLCPSGPGLISLSTRDRGHVWSGGGAVSQWARPDLTVNKRQWSHVVRGRGCVPVGQA